LDEYKCFLHYERCALERSDEKNVSVLVAIRMAFDAFSGSRKVIRKTKRAFFKRGVA
jgi:hypothetical protein